MINYIKLGFLISVIFLAHSKALAINYTPLTGLPWLQGNLSIKDFFNQLYMIAIFFGISASVLIIAYSGIVYMTTDLFNNKKEALERIRSALTGLILLLGTYIILYLVNPDLVSLQFLTR